jgi:DNA-binding MarR family transcriptional regulator
MPNRPIQTSIVSYLRGNLGIAVEVAADRVRPSGLPFFATDGLTLYLGEIAERPVTFAISDVARPLSVARVVQQLRAVQEHFGQPALLVRERIPSYYRRRLIEARASFLAPGTQLFLPYAGIDLRERQPREVAQSTGRLTPSAQALFLLALHRDGGEQPWNAAELLGPLGYSAMTASRAVRELERARLVVSEQVGRHRLHTLSNTRRTAWHHAQPVLSSPVIRAAWVVSGSAPASVKRLRAGELALADVTLLAPPTWEVWAVSRGALAGVKTVQEHEPGAELWQEWSYGPGLLPNRAAVDPLSLILSVRSDADERIVGAREELEAQFLW